MKKPLATLSLALFAASGQGNATQLDVEIINLTRGSWFTPLLVTAHPDSARLFSAGSSASANLQSMAEGGDITGLAAEVSAISAVVVENPAGGLLGPGKSTRAALNTDGSPDNVRLSIVAMILPSNDGFVGLNGIAIPSAPGRYIYTVNAYDAGTEANNEIVGGGAPGEAGFPVPPPLKAEIGSNGSGVPATAEGFVHIHRNVLGDDNPGGGISDMTNTVHRWLNPIARVIVTVAGQEAQQ